MTGKILVQTALLLLYGIIALCEVSAEAVNENMLERIAPAVSEKRMKRLKKISDRQVQYLGRLRAASLLAGFLGTAAAVANFSGKLAGLMTALSAKAAYGVSTVVIAAVYLAAVLVFGEIVPKKAAAERLDRIAPLMSRSIVLASGIAAPAAFPAELISGGILRLMGIDPKKSEAPVTEEEILMMSDAGAENGTIDEDENRIIKNVFAFDDLTADQVCTHRTDVSVLWTRDPIEVWEETIHRTRHSVFPVCAETVDRVIGILDAKDYFRLEDKSRENIMANAVREPYFVHENMKADRLFEQMKRSGADHFAVVVDEYGGMSGIVTITDLVEELVGDFADEEPDAPIMRLEQIGENVWTVPGITSLADVSSELDIDLPADKYDTFSGYIIAALGEIPADGTQVSIETDGLIIDVLEVRHHRVELCRVDISGRIGQED